MMSNVNLSASWSREVTQNKGIISKMDPYNMGLGFKLGQVLEAHINSVDSNEDGLDDWIKNMDGSISVLKARKEKLQKTQAKYWVELAEEEDERLKETKALVPAQNLAVGDLAQGLWAVSLKRKPEDLSETPVSKRRKDYNQDSPKGARDQEHAEKELKCWEDEEGLVLFKLMYEGNFNFNYGTSHKKVGNVRRKIQKALFPGNEPNMKLVLRDGNRVEDESRDEYMEREEEINEERCGGWPKIATEEQ